MTALYEVYDSPEHFAQEMYIPLSKARKLFDLAAEGIEIPTEELPQIYIPPTTVGDSNNGNGQKENTPKDHLSHNALERLACPRYFWKSFYNHPEETSFAVAEEGKKNHEAIEQWIKENNFQVLEARFNSKAPKIKKLLSPFLPTPIGVNDRAQKLLVEHEVRVKVIDQLPDMLGYVDLAVLTTDEAVIIDHKSNGGDEATQKEIRQLKRYAGMLSIQHTIPKDIPTKLYIHRIGKKMIEVDTVIPAKEEEYLREELYEKLPEIERIISQPTEPEPKAGPHCKYCPYILSCPLANLSPQNEEELAQTTIVTYHRLNALKELFDEVVVDSDGNSTGWTTYTAKTSDKKGVEKLLNLVINGQMDIKEAKKHLSITKPDGLEHLGIVIEKTRRKFVVAEKG